MDPCNTTDQKLSLQSCLCKNFASLNMQCFIWLEFVIMHKLMTWLSKDSRRFVETTVGSQHMMSLERGHFSFG